MTVIRPNSVSGINSITAQADEIKVFKSNGTQGGLIIGGANLNATSGISTLSALNVTGNVSIGGTLTYQDVTNIDSVGLITARAGVNVSGGQLDVGSNIKLGTAGVITATSLDISGDIDVDGHTNLDNVSIVGVTTFNGLSTNDVIRVRAADTNGVSVINILAEGTTGHSRIKFSDTAGTDSQISYTHTDRALTFATAGTTERLRIDSSGRLLLGTTDTHGSDADDLVVATSGTTGITIRSGTSGSGNIYFADGNSGTSLYRGRVSYNHGDDSLFLGTANASDSLKISSDGNVSIRTTGTPNFDRGADYGLYIAGSTYQKAGMAIRVDANDDNPASIVLAKSRSSGNTLVGRYDDIGQLDFLANDGAGFHAIARVAGSMDGENSVPGNNDMPGNLRFFTCEDSGTGLTERARIHSWGGLELSNCKMDYGSCDASHSYFYTFHKSGTYNNFYVDIGFMQPGGYNLEMMLGGFNDRRMHSTAQGYVYNGSHFGSIGAIDSGNGPQRNWSVINNYGSYGSLMRFAFTSMSITHAVVTMRLSFGPAGGSGRTSRAEISDVQWS